MREWTKPEVSQLGVENTKENSTTKGDSSSWIPIVPSKPILPAS